MFSPRTRALLEALLVTFLWSTSWIFIKIGLADIPALTFAGLRYTTAFGCLALLLFRPGRRAALATITGKQWVGLAGLGILQIAVAQGAQFVALASLPAASLTLLLNFSALVIAGLGIAFLKERLARWQWVGIGVFLVGVLIYFYPPVFPESQMLGLIAALVALTANAVGSVFGRAVNRAGTFEPYTITLITLGVGGITMLIIGIGMNGVPTLNLTNWLTILWLAVVNTAFAFTLWNRVLRTIPAAEAGVINNTMLIQIAVLAWIFLGEALSPVEIMGIGLAAGGILLVQVGRYNGVK